MFRRLVTLFALALAGLFLSASTAHASGNYEVSTGAGTVSTTTVSAGEKVTFSGSGFAAGSEIVIAVNGDRVTTVRADSTGRFTVSLAVGSYSGSVVLSATGVTPDGAPRVVTATITVVGADQASAAGGGLPRTGTDVIAQLWVAGGLIALGAGMVALTVVRRRETTEAA